MIERVLVVRVVEGGGGGVRDFDYRMLVERLFDVIDHMMIDHKLEMRDYSLWRTRESDRQTLLLI